MVSALLYPSSGDLVRVRHAGAEHVGAVMTLLVRTSAHESLASRRYGVLLTDGRRVVVERRHVLAIVQRAEDRTDAAAVAERTRFNPRHP